MYDGNPAVDSVAIDGPFKTAGPGDTPSRRADLSLVPARRRRPRDEEPCARTDSLDARAARLPPAGHRRRRPDAARVLPDGRGRDGGFDAGIQLALERILVDPDFLFRIERDPASVAAGQRLSRSATSSWRRGCRSSSGAASRTTSCSTLAARGQAEGAGGAASSRCGACSPIRARRRWSTNFAGQWLHAAQRPRRRARSGSRSRTSTRTCARRSSARPSCSSRASCARIAASLELLTRRLHVRQRAAGAALRHPERLRQPLPARHADRRPARRPARPGQRPDGDVVSEPDVAGAARQVAAREHPRRAAAAAAARRAGAAGQAARTASPQSVRERLEEHRKNPACATLPRADGSARVRARELRRDRHVAHERRGRHADRRVGRAAGRHQRSRASTGCARCSLGRRGRPVRRHRHREAADLRARPRRRVLRPAGACARIVRDARRATAIRWSSIVARASSTSAPFQMRRSRVMIVTKKAHAAADRAARPGRRRWRCRCSTAWCRRSPPLRRRRPRARSRRFGVVYVPNGMVMQNWTPASEGAGFEFTPTLKPLEPFRGSADRC